MALGAIVGSIRAVFRAAVPGLLRQGLGANAILRWARSNIGTFRRTEMLKDVRQISGLAKYEKGVRALAGRAIFPQYLMVPSEFRAARRYLIHGIIDYLDPLTGVKTQQHISFYSNTRKTKFQWLNDWFEKASWTDSKELAALHSVEITSVEIKKGWSI